MTGEPRDDVRLACRGSRLRWHTAQRYGPGLRSWWARRGWHGSRGTCAGRAPSRRPRRCGRLHKDGGSLRYVPHNITPVMLRTQLCCEMEIQVRRDVSWAADRTHNFLPGLQSVFKNANSVVSLRHGFVRFSASIPQRASAFAFISKSTSA